MQLGGDAFDHFKIWTALNVIRWRFSDGSWQSYRHPRVAAVIAGVPYAVDFDMASFAAPAVPLGIVTAGEDHWLSPLPPNLTGLAAELLGDPPGLRSQGGCGSGAENFRLLP